MILLLPPSETKRDGGDADRTLDLAQLGFPNLTRARRETIAALRRLSRNLRAATTGLRLGAAQRFEIDRNRVLAASPVLPALERYTGVLFDALGVETLDRGARAHAGRHLVIHSALFGLLRADDPIPAYRLSHDSKLPGLSLRKHWAPVIGAELAATPGLIVDLRSEGYARLGPLPDRADCVYVHVVSETESGQRKALNHFNKAGKGAFARAVAESGLDHPDVDSLLAWAATAGIRLERRDGRSLDLVV